MQDPLVLNSHHVPRHHLQPDMVLFTVHQIIKGSHSLEQIFHHLKVHIQMRITGKVAPVDSTQLTSSIVAEK